MFTPHPSPGLGLMLPAYWTLPQNPLATPLATLARSLGVGAIISGLDFAGPDNGVIPEILAKQKAAEYLTRNPNGPVGLSSCGQPGYPCGMGNVLDDVLGSVTSSMGNWQTWAMVGAGVLALVMFTGGGGAQRSSELAAAKAQYKAKVASIRAARPRRYQKYV